MITINQIDTSFEFLQNLKDIKFTTTGTSCEVKITSAALDDDIYDETLYPDVDGLIELCDIADMLEDAVRENLYDIFTISLTDSLSDTATAYLKVIYAKKECKAFATYANEEFLNYPGDYIRTCVGRKELLALWQYTASGDETSPSASVRAYFTDGTYEDTTLTLTSGASKTQGDETVHLYSVDVSAKQFVKEDKEMYRYVVICGNRTKEYLIDTEHEEADPVLLFANSFGVPELLYCNGTKESEATYERSATTIKGKYRNYKIKETRNWNIDTGILTTDEEEWVLDMLSSDSVYECKLEDGIYSNWKEVAITDSEAKYTNDADNLPRYTFTYRLSQRTQGIQPWHTFPYIFTEAFDLHYD